MPRRSNSRAALPGSPLISTDDPRTDASALASDVKRLMASGDRDDARELAALEQARRELAALAGTGRVVKLADHAAAIDPARRATA